MPTEPAAEPEGASTACADRLDRWSRALPEPKRISLTRASCSLPCENVLRAEYETSVHGGYPEHLSNAQRLSNELGVEITEWVPLEGSMMRYVVECREP